MVTLADSTSLLSLLADATRVRLLALLHEEELSVAELTKVTELSQSRVSTHLGKLREAGLVTQRPQGASTLYRAHAAMPDAARRLWALLKEQVSDSVLEADADRCEALVRAREEAWPDAVAGQMERHYSPGRTWEATARGFLGLATFGEVLDLGSGDGTLAALIAPRADGVTCVDRSDKVLAAAKRRLEGAQVEFVQADFHELPFDDDRFDTVMLFNALTYAHTPARVLEQAARVLKPAGHIALVTLAAHDHDAITRSYGHLRPGFAPDHLARLLQEAGLRVTRCEVTSRERRKPYFEVVTAFARKPS
ncbi:MAG: metalloregulator ArsR/SmtB family transcription factor [Sandaracinaceae bacterium]